MCYPIMFRFKLPSNIKKLLSKAFEMNIHQFEEKLGMGFIWGTEFEDVDASENDSEGKDKLGGPNEINQNKVNYKSNERDLFSHLRRKEG